MITTNEDGVRKLAKTAVERAGSLRALAREWKMSPAGLYRFLSGDTRPGPKILGPLGLQKSTVTTYSTRRPYMEP